MTRPVTTSNNLSIASVRLMALISLVVALLIIIASLALDVRNRLAAMERANSDNGNWVMMQTEVEVLRLQYTLSAARSGNTDLAEVRRWFDVLYSRVRMVRHSPLYASFIQDPANLDRLDHMQAYLDRWLPIIDGPDSALVTALAEMETESAAVRQMARSLSLDSLLIFSARTDETRVRVSDTLLRLAIAIAATILLLAVLAAMATRLYRITRRQAEENQLTGTRLQMIIATSPDAIVVTNRGGWVVEFNRAAEKMFGWTRAEVMGRQIVPMIFSDEDRIAYQARLSDLITHAVVSGPQRFEMMGRRTDGSRFPLEISMAIRDLNPGALIVGFLRDVSDRKAAQLVLERALTRARAGEKAKADFLAVMSHEMRTPLNGLIGSMDLLRGTTLDANQHELLRVMQVSGDILLGHVNTVLDISSSEAGEIRLSKTAFDLDSLIGDCISNQLSVARSGGNTIRHVPLTGQLGTVWGDPGRLQQILLNLIGNAVKFTRNGTITVETERLPQRPGVAAPQMVEFRIIDTGIGIATADLDRVFDDFATVNSSYGRETSGTGLGLGIARRLVHALGGIIGAESEPGDGSVFWLRLPLPAADAPHRASGEASTPAPDGPPVQPELDILLIEDNDINRFLLHRYLADTHHSVTEAADGLEGVAIAQTSRFDIIITDISMPGLDGIEATSRIRASGASAKARIIALTAHALPADLDRFRQAGMDVCLTKPVSRAELLAQVHELAIAPQVPVSQQTACVLDTVVLAELADHLGASMAVTLIHKMLDDGDTTIANITAAPEPKNDIARAAHQYAGLCATFGAVRLRDALTRLEWAITHEDEDEALNLVAGLGSLWDDTRHALSSHAATLVA
ncbi:MAG: ATP-binding protein [Paracoccaceae bacterium]